MCGVGDQTQGFTNARQSFCHLAVPPDFRVSFTEAKACMAIIRSNIGSIDCICRVQSRYLIEMTSGIERLLIDDLDLCFL